MCLPSPIGPVPAHRWAGACQYGCDRQGPEHLPKHILPRGRRDICDRSAVSQYRARWEDVSEGAHTSYLRELATKARGNQLQTDSQVFHRTRGDGGCVTGIANAGGLLVDLNMGEDGVVTDEPS